ncbi:MAG: dihydroneopterin aldolase [Acidimicrobiales bacterium]
MKDVIELRELRVDAIVGVLDRERRRAQPLAFDIDLQRSFAQAAKNDDLTKTTNYADVLTLTTKVAVEGKFLLLETLATRVAQKILDFDPAIKSVSVSVRKLQPPVPEDVATVGVRTTLRR